jgi:hypothetical protein
MRVRDIATSLAGLIAVMASAAAMVSIRLLLTDPATLGGSVHGGGDPLHVVARALYEVLAGIVRYL